MEYKCEICKKITDWDSSVGYTEFIVCNHCVREMMRTPKDLEWIMQVIFRMAIARRERNGTQEENN